MTEEQIFELAKSCGITPNKYEVCVTWKDELLKFARAIRQNGYDEGYEDGVNMMRNVKDYND